MDTETEIALLKQEAKQARNERTQISKQVEKLDAKLDKLNLSLARYRGMAGMALLILTLLGAGAKMAISYFKGA